MYSHHSSLCFFGNVSFTEVIGLIWGGGGFSLPYFSMVQSVAVVSCIWERGRILERKWNKEERRKESSSGVEGRVRFRGRLSQTVPSLWVQWRAIAPYSLCVLSGLSTKPFGRCCYTFPLLIWVQLCCFVSKQWETSDAFPQSGCMCCQIYILAWKSVVDFCFLFFLCEMCLIKVI